MSYINVKFNHAGSLRCHGKKWSSAALLFMYFIAFYVDAVMIKNLITEPWEIWLCNLIISCWNKNETSRRHYIATRLTPSVVRKTYGAIRPNLYYGQSHVPSAQVNKIIYKIQIVKLWYLSVVHTNVWIVTIVTILSDTQCRKHINHQ